MHIEIILFIILLGILLPSLSFGLSAMSTPHHRKPLDIPENPPGHRNLE